MSTFKLPNSKVYCATTLCSVHKAGSHTEAIDPTKVVSITDGNPEHPQIVVMFDNKPYLVTGPEIPAWTGAADVTPMCPLTVVSKMVLKKCEISEVDRRQNEATQAPAPTMRQDPPPRGWIDRPPNYRGPQQRPTALGQAFGKLPGQR
jgi:hypothetical protein